MIKGGGFRAIKYTYLVGKKVGFRNLATAIFSKNTCKTCAFGMGGQKGGAHNEEGNFPEFCKKAVQAQLTDIQKPIPESVFANTSIQAFKDMKSLDLECLGRLNTPLYKKSGDTHYHTITWDKALSLITKKMKAVAPERSFFYSSGRSSNEAAFVLQLFARLYGTNNINNCSFYCHQASGVGMNSSLGTGTATIQFTDLKNADLLFVIGANPASNHPRYLTSLAHCRRRGGHVVIINPAKEPGLVNFVLPQSLRSLLWDSEIASEYIQPHIGGDIALLKGIAKYVLENSKENKSFIDSHTNNFLTYKSDIEAYSWKDICEQSGVSKEEIAKVGQIYCDAKNVVFSWSMGITHHAHGSQNVESIVSLALLRGMVGKKGSGLLPLRGHSNVQGISSVGLTPSLKTAFLKAIESKLVRKFSDIPGMDTMACMEAAYDGKIDFAFLLGGNLYASNPDSTFSEKALGKIPFKVFLNTTLNKGHFFGVDEEVTILPAKARDEEEQATTQESMFNFVRMSDGNIVRLNNTRSETDIILNIASQLIEKDVYDFEIFHKYQNIREAIAKTVPGFEAMEKIDSTHNEFQISGRTLHTPKFPTDNGKANFIVVTPPQRPLLNHGQFLMMSMRSEGQFNSIIYEEEDIYRGQTKRSIVLMHPKDMESLGIREGDHVVMHNETGKLSGITAHPFSVKRGNVMTYYPEGNVLIPRIVDKRSRTPGFKSALVTISSEKK